MQRRVLYLANVSAKRNYLQTIYFMKEKKSPKILWHCPLKTLYRPLCTSIHTNQLWKMYIIKNGHLGLRFANLVYRQRKNWQIPSQKTTNKDFRMQRFCTEGSTEKRCSSLAKVHSTWLRQSTVSARCRWRVRQENETMISLTELTFTGLFLTF